MEHPLAEQEAVPALWNAYKKTEEYKVLGMRAALPAHSRLVEKQEEEGLQRVYGHFIREFGSNRSFADVLVGRNIGEWLTSWKEMHKELFKHILRSCGEWKEAENTFGDLNDDTLQKLIAKPHDVNRRMTELANKIMTEYLPLKGSEEQEKVTALAKIHFEFVIIHPFKDGNGRVARATTDLMSVYFGMPPVMAGYPRHDKARRNAYHASIIDCVRNSDCSKLAMWINGYLEEHYKRLA